MENISLILIVVLVGLAAEMAWKIYLAARGRPARPIRLVIDIAIIGFLGYFLPWNSLLSPWWWLGLVVLGVLYASLSIRAIVTARA